MHRPLPRQVVLIPAAPSVTQPRQLLAPFTPGSAHYLHMKKKYFISIIGAICLLYLCIVFSMTWLGKGVANSNIQTFGDAFWCSLTLTTVGYGDRFPVSFGGRVLSLFFIFGSLWLISFFVGSVSEIIREHKEMQKMRKKGTTFTNHVVVLGWDEFARATIEQLVRPTTRSQSLPRTRKTSTALTTTLTIVPPALFTAANGRTKKLRRGE